MKKSNLFKIGLKVCLPAIFLLVLSFQKSTAQTIGSEFCTEGNDQITGISQNFSYELWNKNIAGVACMTLGDGCLFSGSWKGIQNYLARRGFKYDQTQGHQDYGRYTASYDCNYNPDPEGSPGNSYLSIYGWTYNADTDDLVEYYIIEDWRNWIPSMADSAVSRGSITVNGDTYEIVTVPQNNAPSILGNRDFTQYFSIRNTRRSSGTISISDHFNKWESLGMEMGNMYEVTFVVEGYKSNGSFEFTSLDVSVDTKIPE